MNDARDTLLLLGHSPDPDDAFMFYAMAEEKIDLRGYRFQHILQDIQTLNERAIRGELHISAVSIHALSHILDKYALLPCGASMGDGYGPVFVTQKKVDFSPTSWQEAKDWLRQQRIAIPGTMTSAFLAARIFLGEFDYIVVPFDEIFDAVRQGKADVGLLIHEGQLTYELEGFTLAADLGVWWQHETDNLPLPLGGNVIRKDIPIEQQKEISDILKESIAYGLKHRAPAVTHSMPLARGMDESLADKFIGMYVNDLTMDYGERGRKGITEFLKRGVQAGVLHDLPQIEFVK